MFSAIGVRITVSGYDAVDPNARDPVTGGFPVEPPIIVSVSARVEINGGTNAGRVPGLRVFGDGTEVAEVGSAGSPQKFDFQYRPSGDLVHGRSMELELRYQGSSVSVRVAPPVVDISSPGADQTVPANQTLVLQWTGVATPPVQAYISPRGPNCTTSFRASPGDTTTFVPRAETGPGRQEPPCRFELSADWHVEDVPSPTPLRSLRIERDTRRIQRFTVR